MTVVTDANEVVGAAAVDMATTNEASANDNTGNFPLGTMGFSLNYAQQVCPWSYWLIHGHIWSLLYSSLKMYIQPATVLKDVIFLV